MKTPDDFRADILDPARFAQNVLRHRIWSKQAEILRAVKDRPLVAVKSCHASGKTFSIAEIVLWWLARWSDGIAITTSSTWMQVRKEIWGEIHKAMRGAMIKYPIPNQTEMQIGPDCFALGLSTNEGRESAAALDALRELRAELPAMRQEIRLELRDETLTYEHRAALREIANDLRELHQDTRIEIAALQREQPGYEHKVVEIGHEPATTALMNDIQGAAGLAADVVGGMAEIGGKAVDFVADFLFTPSAPTPEMIHARREAKEEAAQAATDWKRYEADQAYRDKIDEQERAKREQDEQRKYYERGRGERER